MKAVVCPRYGSADVLELQDVDPPAVKGGEVLVRIHAASVNPFDWHDMTGKPYLLRIGAFRRPRRPILGVDVAGRVEAVGNDVTKWQPGDEVFGVGPGAFADYLCASEDKLARKPANLTFDQAAAVPVAGITALQGLRDAGRIRSGHRVLINGASGGVGTFAVQLAKSFGAEVTGVCSTRNVDLVRSIGADHVVDYTRDNFTESGQRYDLMLDMVGSATLSACRRVLEREAVYVSIGAKMGDWIGPLIHILKVTLASWFGSPKMTFMLARIRHDDLNVLGELLEKGQVKPVIGRRCALSQVPDALRHQGERHARGKTIIHLDEAVLS